MLHVLKELKDKDFASLSFSFIHSTFEIVPQEQYSEEMDKEKDLEHLATARSIGIDIIAYDRDFEGIEEYFTPKRFLESLKLTLKTYDTIY